MKKRSILLILVLGAIVSVYWMSRPGKEATIPTPSQADAKFLTEDSQLAGISNSAVQSPQRLKDPALMPVREGGVPRDILDALRDCLGITLPDESKTALSNTTPSNTTPSETEKSVVSLSVEEALSEIEKDLGPPLMQGDLWTDWVVRLPEGLDRKVHLENVNEAEGRVHQILSVYEIDQSGNANRIHVASMDEKNPDMSAVFTVLNAGEVQRKETSRYYQYAKGERLEWIELNNKPTELEIVRDEIFFRCDEMKNAENCHCIR